MTDSSAGASSPDIAGRSRIIERIERNAGVPNLTDVLVDRLAPTDLQSLLLEVYGRRAKKRDPKELIKDHISNRFARPSTASQLAFLNGITSRSRDYRKSSSLSNSHRFAR